MTTPLADLITTAKALVDESRRDSAAQRIADETTCPDCGAHVPLNQPDCDACWYATRNDRPEDGE